MHGVEVDMEGAWCWSRHGGVHGVRVDMEECMVLE